MQECQKSRNTENNDEGRYRTPAVPATCCSSVPHIMNLLLWYVTTVIYGAICRRCPYTNEDTKPMTDWPPLSGPGGMLV